MRVGHHGVGDGAAEVVLLHRLGHGALLREQEAGAHRDAGRAVGERGDEAAAVEEAARRDHRDVDRVDDLREQQRGGDRAGVAAALAALHDHRVGAPRRDLLGVAPGADRRHHRDARVLQLLDLVLARARARTTRPARCSRTSSATRASASSASARRFTPNGRSVRALHLADRRRELVEGHRRRREDAERARVRRSRSRAAAPATQPMPVCTIGTSMPNRSQIRVRRSRRAHGLGTSFSPRPSGSMTSRIQRSSSSVGSRVSGTSPGSRARSRSRRPRRRRSRPGAPSAGACGGRACRSRRRRGW